MGYNNRNYNNNGRQNNYKTTGCQWGRTKKGDKYLYGWNKSKSMGLMTFSAFFQEEGKTSEGRTYHQYLVKVNCDKWAKEQLFTGFFNPQTQKLVIPDLRRGMVANPNAGQGRTRSGKVAKGYFGTFKTS